MDLEKINDRIYGRCIICHKKLKLIEKTSNKWLHRLVGADTILIRKCLDHNYMRIDKENYLGYSIREFNPDSTVSVSWTSK